MWPHTLSAHPSFCRGSVSEGRERMTCRTAEKKAVNQAKQGWPAVSQQCYLATSAACISTASCSYSQKAEEHKLTTLAWICLCAWCGQNTTRLSKRIGKSLMDLFIVTAQKATYTIFFNKKGIPYMSINYKALYTSPLYPKRKTVCNQASGGIFFLEISPILPFSLLKFQQSLDFV